MLRILRLSALLLSALAAAPLFASQPYLVKDINLAGSPYASSNPSAFVSVGDLVFFQTAAGSDGVSKLWRTDGTAGGTFVVAPSVVQKVAWNGRLWFRNGNNELWSTDGTVDGTHPLIGADSNSVLATFLWAGPSHLYFLSNSQQLWRTDGTAQGTVQMAAAIMAAPVSDATPAVGPTSAIVGQTLYFLARDLTTNRVSLWRADSAGTYPVTQAGPLEAIADPVAVGNLVYYLQRSYKDYITEATLWRTDGTPAGTFAINVPDGVSFPVRSPAIVPGAAYVYFTAPLAPASAAYALWRSDGTNAGTQEIGSLENYPVPMAVLADGTVISAEAQTLQATRGTTSVQLTSALTGNSPGIATVVGNIAFIGAGADLWRTDGTVSGTFSLGQMNSSDWSMAAAGSHVVFGANDGIHGNEPWITDGSLANTHLIADLAYATEPSNPHLMTAFKSGALFLATSMNDSSGSASGLWFSDGSEAGTQKIADNVVPNQIVPCGNRAFFTADSAAGYELYATDGTGPGTTFMDLFPGTTTDYSNTTYQNSTSPSQLTCVDNILFFTGWTSDGMYLWRSDGTLGGTMPIRKLVVASTWSPEQLTRFGHRLVWFMRNVSGVNQLWASNGTPGGTTMVKDVNDCYFSGTFVAAGPNLYFSINGCPDGGSELWHSDGTAMGTITFLHDSWLALYGGLNGRAAFGDLTTGGFAKGLCTSDGTEAGTVCFDPNLSASGSWTFAMREMNGRLWYNMPDLRGTDGAMHTTTSIQYAQRLLATGGGRLYVSGSRFQSPSTYSLFETDGNAAGTVDLGLFATEAVASGGRLFIASGELYAYDFDVTPVSFTPTTVGLAGGDTVQISGRGFTTPVTIRVGETFASVTNVTSTSIAFAAPAEAPGSYTVYVTLGDGRQMTLDQELTYAGPPPTALISSAPASVCALQPAHLSGSGGARCEWFPSTGLDDASSCTPTATIATTTTYTLMVFDANGVPSTNDPKITVTVIPLPSAQITFNNYQMIAHGTYQASVPDGGPGSTYEWSATAAQIVSGGNTPTVTFTPGCVPATLYVTVHSASGCSATNSSVMTPSSGLSITSDPLYRVRPGTIVTLTGSNFDCAVRLRLRQYYYDTLNGSLNVPFSVNSTTSLSFVWPPSTLNPILLSLEPARSWDGASQQFSLASPNDYDGNLTSDLLLQNPQTGAVREWRMSGTTATDADVSPGTAWRVKTSGDFDGDGRQDIVLQNPDTHDIAVWLMNGASITAGLVIGSAGAYVPVATGDLDFDGRDDIIFQDPSTGAVAVWFMNGVTLKSGAVIGGAPGWTVKAAVDLDLDGHADIVLQSTDSTIAAWLMDGATIRAGALIGTPSGWSVVGHGDFNTDGSRDLVLRNSDGSIAVWAMNAFTVTSGVVLGGPGTSWNVATVAGGNIFLRSGSGDIAVWLVASMRIYSGAVVRNPGPGWVPSGN